MPSLDCPRWTVSLAGTLLLAISALAHAQGKHQRLYAYCSTGDNQWVSEWLPVDSPATIDAMFEWLRDTYGVQRMYWRGEQDRIWLENHLIRRENPLYHDWWTNWIGHLTRDVQTDKLAIEAARRQGMEIYAITGIFEHGAQGDVGGCAYFPYATEDRLRVEHPEWCPVDRWGERRAPGPIEWCYPEARKLLVDRYVRHTVQPGYDGIAFYTYVENMGMRYMDEFGFNEPIVAEFRRRYGVDIRTEPFDREAWNRLRGEYFTQFLRELHAALKPRGKKLTMLLRPDQPNLAQRWLAMPTDVLCQGGIHLDWEGWVKERLVDELYIYCGGALYALAERVLEVCRGTDVKVVAFSSSPFLPDWQPLLDQGLALCTVPSPGYGIDPLSLEPTSLETLNSDDWKLRAQTLADIGAGKLSADPSQVAGLLRDRHVLVRREAVRTLGKLKAEEWIGELERALTDSESSVRIQAATALGLVHGPGSAEAVVRALARDAGCQFKQECITALAAMGEAARPALREALDSPHWWVRDVATRALGTGKVPDPENALRVACTDADDRVRYWALAGLTTVAGAGAFDALLAGLAEESATVRVRAATDLATLLRGNLLSSQQAEAAYTALRRGFREYGDGCTRSDAAWGWRPVGMALLACGDRGRKALEAFRDQREDGWLAWAAYEVLHVPQDPNTHILCDEAEAIRIHDKFAPPFPGMRAG
ncbi:MAG: hypothetical protein HPY69_06215 [Armatimonadetes bacterium]|nr:hypothetical protein [Armatimonadota bacterium]